MAENTSQDKKKKKSEKVIILQIVWNENCVHIRNA